MTYFDGFNNKFYNNLHYEWFHKLCFPPEIIKVIKPKRVRRARHVESVEGMTTA